LTAPLIGIWWDDGKRRAVLAHPLDENATGDVLVDSNLGHIHEWPKISKTFGKSKRDEYFSVPRGRVIYDRRKKRGIIYHGPSTSPGRLKEIAAEFHLEKWVACLDEHYSMGDDADWLFDDE
jgi:hypothetical protein